MSDARERMRQHRAKYGGSSPADVARREALRELAQLHRAEFLGLLTKHRRSLAATDSIAPEKALA